MLIFEPNLSARPLFAAQSDPSSSWPDSVDPPPV